MNCWLFWCTIVLLGDGGLPEAGQLAGSRLRSSLYRDVPPAGEDSAPGSENCRPQRRDTPQYLRSRSPPSLPAARHTGPERGDEMSSFNQSLSGWENKYMQRREQTCSICSNVDEAAMVAGASSMIFWCLLWMEQSRPNSEMAFPYSSARIWTSRCLACWASCMTKMGEPGTSVWTCTQTNTQTTLWESHQIQLHKAGSKLERSQHSTTRTCLKKVAKSSELSTLRIPFPPPPSEALITTG